MPDKQEIYARQDRAKALSQGAANAEEDDWSRRIKSYLAQPLTEITESEHQHQLNQLPPLLWTTNEGVSVFCCCEAQIAHIHLQYAKAGDRYFTKYVDIHNRATWISTAKVQAYIAEEADRDEYSPMPKSAKRVMLDEVQRRYPKLDRIAIDTLVDDLHERLYYAGRLK